MFELLYVGSIFCALVTIYLLLFSENALRSYANYLLAAFFILQIWCLIIYISIHYGWIVNVPYLFKITAPVNFILPPLTYLYVRSILYNEKKFSAIEAWHFLPFLLFLINYAPFYLLPISEKTVIVKAIMKDITLSYKYQTGIVPESVFYFFRILQSLVYLTFQWQLIINFKKENANSTIQTQIKNVFQWLKIFTWTSTLFLIALITLSLLAILDNAIFANGWMQRIPDFLFSSTFFVISTYLLTHQSVLLGFPFIKYKEIDSSLLYNQTDKLAFIVEDYSKEINALDQYFIEKQPFLKKGLNISEVAVGTGIPAKELSFIINQHFQKRFNEFVNEYRIQYIIKKLDTGYLTDYTLNTLSSEAGFKSQTTFIAAFRKIKDCTPSEYLQKTNA